MRPHTEVAQDFTHPFGRIPGPKMLRECHNFATALVIPGIPHDSHEGDACLLFHVRDLGGNAASISLDLCLLFIAGLTVT